MSKARDLADILASGSILSDGVISTTEIDGITATAAELNYVDGVTSAIQTQIDSKAPTSSPTFTGTVTADRLTVSGSNNLPVSISNTTDSVGYHGLKINTANTSTATYSLYVRSNDLNRFIVAANGDISFYEDTGTTAKFLWDASAESLGIGTSSPAAKLDIVEATSTPAVKIKSGTSTNQNTHITMFNDNDGGTLALGVFGSSATTFGNLTAADGFISSNQELCVNSQNASGAIKFGVGSTPTERMRIDSSGNLLVGTTDVNPSNNGASGDAGIAFGATGYISAARSNETTALFNRMDSDGPIILLRKNGTDVGRIGTNSGYLYIGSEYSTDSHIAFLGSEIAPVTSTGGSRDAAIDLGASTRRFKDLYLSGTAKVNAVTYTGTDGTSGQVLTTDGSGNATFADAGGGAWNLVSTTTASNSSTIDIEDFSSTYDEYKIIITNLDPVNNNVDLQLRFKVNGSYQTGNDYEFFYLQSNSNSSSASGASGTQVEQIKLARPMSNSETPNFFEMSIFDANNTGSNKGIIFNGVLKNNGYAYTSFGVGALDSSGYALQGARFYFNSGNINTGTFKLYGIVKS